MDAALYDPDGGFYARPPVGPRGDFVTSPHVSGAFGFLLATQLEGMWQMLGRPDPFDVVEAGAGDGTLARTILTALQDRATDCAGALRYRAVEISDGARDALSAAGIDVFQSLNQIGDITDGCVIANELLDNLPFHRLRMRDGVLVEVFVDVGPNGLVEVEAAPTPDAVAALGDAVIPDGGERPVAPAQKKFVEQACGVLKRGWVVLFDYGFDAGEDPSQVRAFQAHRVHTDLLTRPGSADVTAGADFAAVSKAARAAGHRVFGPRSQRDVLLALGFRDWYDALRNRRLAAEQARDTRAILSLVSQQSRAPLLIDAAHLGGLKAIAIGVNTDQPPPGF